MIAVQLPDGSLKEMPPGSSALDVAQGIGARLAAACIAAEVNGKVVDVRAPLPTDTSPVTLKLMTDKDPAALNVLRHSTAHVMARAVMRLWPDVKLAFGPTIANGFYYDIDSAHKISEDDFPKIEEEMRKIIELAETFDRFSLDRKEALQLVGDLKQDLKTEHIETGLGDHPSMSFYRQGEFVDLCRGPHIPDAGRIKAFKLLSIAGSYWKGDANNRRLQRLYGTAWFNQKDLDGYMAQVEEARRRDHRVLGKQFGLFTISQEVGAGLCLWMPKGATIRSLLEDFIKVELMKRGYQPVYSPHIGRVELYETSGHFPYYRDSQFPPLFGHSAGQLVDFWIRSLKATQAGVYEAGEKQLTAEDEAKLIDSAMILGCNVAEYKVGDAIEKKIEILRTWETSQERYLLKPMNCPHHAQIYKSQPRSYRDLPVRLAEFGTVYRHEQSGELNGLLRVRGLTQDDAHLFCTSEQVEGEFRDTIELVRFVLGSLGLDDYRVQLSLRDPKSDKYVGSEENWQRAEASLRKVLTDLGLNFTAAEGEAAFYGPKADFMVRDCIGREWQLGTVQLDYNLPERFQLEYIGADNKPHRPVMIHRAPFGSMERFVGVLIEHFAGAFPLWIAPEQVRVMPISEKFDDYAKQVTAQFREAGFRATMDTRSSKINAKIRDGQLELIPYMLVVGGRDQEQGTVAVRDRIEGDLGAMPVAEAIARLTEEVKSRRIRQVAKPTFTNVDDAATVEENEY